MSLDTGPHFLDEVSTVHSLLQTCDAGMIEYLVYGGKVPAGTGSGDSGCSAASRPSQRAAGLTNAMTHCGFR
jgi:hypothetical protein